MQRIPSILLQELKFGHVGRGGVLKKVQKDVASAGVGITYVKWRQHSSYIAIRCNGLFQRWRLHLLLRLLLLAMVVAVVAVAQLLLPLLLPLLPLVVLMVIPLLLFVLSAVQFLLWLLLLLELKGVVMMAVVLVRMRFGCRCCATFRGSQRGKQRLWLMAMVVLGVGIARWTGACLSARCGRGRKCSGRRCACAGIGCTRSARESLTRNNGGADDSVAFWHLPCFNHGVLAPVGRFLPLTKRRFSNSGEPEPRRPWTPAAALDMPGLAVPRCLPARRIGGHG